MKKAYCRHGDLVLSKLDSLPKNLKKVEGSILAHGESGHVHRLQVKEKFQLLEDDKGLLYFEVEKPTPLVHEEHSTITVEPGFYVVEHEQEFDYAMESIKRVVD